MVVTISIFSRLEKDHLNLIMLSKVLCRPAPKLQG